MNLQKYKSNQHYKKLYEKEVKNLNRNYKFFKAKTKQIKKDTLHNKIVQLDPLIDTVISNKKHDEKLDAISKLEFFWPDLEIEFHDLKNSEKSLEIPKEIPMNEQRLDLEEAIRDFDNGCYLSSLVLCRRAYEGCLVEAYRSMMKTDPLEDVICKHCKSTIRAKSYMGIGKLHHWAIENKLITDKLKQVGFLVSDIGAGGAHPPLEQFQRDPEIAKLGITAAITLIKQIHTKK